MSYSIRSDIWCWSNLRYKFTTENDVIKRYKVLSFSHITPYLMFLRFSNKWHTLVLFFNNFEFDFIKTCPDGILNTILTNILLIFTLKYSFTISKFDKLRYLCRVNIFSTIITISQWIYTVTCLLFSTPTISLFHGLIDLMQNKLCSTPRGLLFGNHRIGCREPGWHSTKRFLKVDLS